MSSITITTSVTLKSGNLDVDDHGHAISVAQETDATNLVWQLTGNAAQGSFNAMNAANPGFSWIDTPPTGVFGSPALAANGNQITLSDDNCNSNSAGGPWRYKLWATIDGVQYSTTASVSTRATTNDPGIKNN